MCSICADTQHKFHHSHQLYKKSLREIDIPPRKLLSRSAARSVDSMYHLDSPKLEDAVFSKFLPYNNADDDGSDPYSSDHFRMYEFKVRKCTRSRSHDWTDCPFAHPGEKARRRDPRRYHYNGTVCSEFRKGHCGKGDNCEFSHGVFECWLHPSRYRTEACKDGKNCKRKVCFFAHSTRQLRIVPEASNSPPPRHDAANTHCCVFCHSVMASPTSTLMGIAHSTSPPLSPPISPVDSPDFAYHGGSLSYKDALNELMNSMEGMSMSMSHEVAVGSPVSGKMNLPWLDVNFGMEEQNQPQFVMSPSSPSPGSSKFGIGGSNSSRFARVQEQYSGRNLMEERINAESMRYYNNNNNINNNNGAENNLGGPDLGWVNDLLT